MWGKFADFLLKAHASGLGHDAVIEIMIALLGVMVAALSIIAVLISFALVAIGIFGFRSIKDEATKSATAIAKKTATEIASRVMEESNKRAQASGLSESQAEELSRNPRSAIEQKRSRIKATNDKGLQNPEGTP